MDLDGKRILLTGASSGIGRALLEQLARRRAEIVAVARDEVRLREAVGALPSLPARVLPFACDLGRQGDVDRLFAFAAEEMGGIDVLIANAGFAYWERIGSPDWGRIEAIFRTNVFSPIYALQKMEALSPGGAYRVVITSSALGSVGLEGYALYAATKAALDRFAEAYRLEGGRRGQLVLVYPLAVRSDFFQAAGGAPIPWLCQSPEAAARAILRGIEKDRETIYGSWVLRPLLWLNGLLPFARRWYQALDGRASRRQWARRERNRSEPE